MNRQPVESSNIRSVGHDPEKNVLEVEFTNGGLYQYADVPAKVHEELIGADSVGKYFGANVRNSFKATRIDQKPQD